MTEPTNNKNIKRVDFALNKMSDKQVPNQTLHQTVDDLTRRRTVDAVLNRVNDPKTYSKRAQLITPMAIAAGIFTTIALWSIFSFNSNNKIHSVENLSKTMAATEPGASELVPQSSFALLHGEVVCNESSVKLGSGVPTNRWLETRDGQAEFSLPTGIAVGLSENTSTRITWNGKRKYGVELNQGMALFSIDPNKERDAFWVTTPKGKIVVTGTLFTVQVLENGEVMVQLHKGSVNIIPTTGEPIVVNTNEVIYLKQDGTHNIHKPSTGSDFNDLVVAQLQKVGCIDEGRIFSELDNTGCTGADTDTLKNKNLNIISEKKQQRRSVAPKASHLLQEARTARSEGRFNDSADALQTLIRYYPKGNDARTAQVLLGRLKLNQLGKYKQALTHFSIYLKKPGPLTQEAMWGKAKAERLIGLVKNEKATLVELLKKFPNGAAANAARARLSQLK